MTTFDVQKVQADLWLPLRSSCCHTGVGRWQHHIHDEAIALCLQQIVVSRLMSAADSGSRLLFQD